jgi:hypothetical protein
VPEHNYLHVEPQVSDRGDISVPPCRLYVQVGEHPARLKCLQLSLAWHCFLQTNSLATINGEWAVDYIGRVEHFYEDFMELLSILNSRDGVPKLPEELPGQLNRQPDECNFKSKQNSTECNKMVHFTGKHEHCYDRITTFYASDLALLGHAQ